MRLRVLACLGIAGMMAACSGGGGGSSGSPVITQSLQTVTGTLSIVTADGTTSSTASSAERKPAYVSSATTHASVYINGSATPNGSTSTCSGKPTEGTGTGCTISWTATLAVPHAYIFAVEIDNGSKVLAEGAGSYTIQSGSNTLSALSLNGVVAQATGWKITSCATSTCSGTVTLADAAGDTIEYTGTTQVPTNGNSPSSGNVFDNNGGGSSNVTFTSSNTSASTGGSVTGTAQTSGSNTFSTFTSPTLTVVGVGTTGTYTLAVSCNPTGTPSSTGSFSITVAGGTTPSGDVPAADLPSGVTYPSSVATPSPQPSFTCTSGTIAPAIGTVVTN
jgi:hypothetical protein